MIDYLRKVKRWSQDNIGFESMVSEVEGTEITAEDQFINLETRDMIIAACGKMTDRERAVLFERLLSDNPTDLRTLAAEHGVSHVMIHKDEQKLKLLIKENYLYDKRTNSKL